MGCLVPINDRVRGVYFQLESGVVGSSFAYLSRVWGCKVRINEEGEEGQDNLHFSLFLSIATVGVDNVIRLLIRL